jgi:hypothetical protein
MTLVKETMTRRLWVRGAALCFAIGMLLGIFLSPLLLRAISVMSVSMTDGEILLVSTTVMLLFLASFLAVRLSQRVLMSLAAQFGQGVAFAVLTPYALDAMMSCLLIGVIVMSMIMLARRRQALTDAHLLIAAAAMGLFVFGLNLVGHNFVLNVETAVALLSITLTSSIVVAWLANQLSKFLIRFRYIRLSFIQATP